MGIYDGLKDVAGVLKQAGKIEEYKQILEDMEKLLELQKHVQDIEMENVELKRKLNARGTVTAEGNMYFTTSKDGAKDGPFCTGCMDSADKLIRLHVDTGSGRTHCPSCKANAIHGRVQIFTPHYDSNK